MKLSKVSVIGILVLLVAMFTITALTVRKGNSGDYDTIAQCLGQKNVKMYGAWWCPHCENQKDAFGDSFQYINYVECAYQPRTNEQKPECNLAGINSYPTWVFEDGSRIESEATPAQLALRAGCPLS